LDPVFAVAPGQAVVLYKGEQVVGGGWITGNKPMENTTRMNDVDQVLNA
jgi:hypothetical protein